jgi:hypothetical protein
VKLAPHIKYIVNGVPIIVELIFETDNKAFYKILGLLRRNLTSCSPEETKSKRTHAY